MFRKLDPDSELGKQVSAFISKDKEGEHMTKKFTEEEYQKIVGIADRLKKEYNMGILNPNVIKIMQINLFDDFDFVSDWPEIVAIANPITRDEAHDKFVEKEKKYFWTGKTTDKDGHYVHISRDDKNKPKIFRSRECNPIGYPFTETEVKAAYLDVDMFEKEEVK